MTATVLMHITTIIPVLNQARSERYRHQSMPRPPGAKSRGAGFNHEFATNSPNHANFLTIPYSEPGKLPPGFLANMHAGAWRALCRARVPWTEGAILCQCHSTGNMLATYAGQALRQGQRGKEAAGVDEGGGEERSTSPQPRENEDSRLRTMRGL